ncbi:MAG: hypothetical protein ACK4UJ_11095 [Leptonema sp. (in: bacteria)]
MISLYQILSKWDLRIWTFIGFLIQLFLIFILNLIYNLLPEKKLLDSKKITVVPEMSFIEYEELTTQEIPQQSKELSEEIVETEKKEKQEVINWQNATDPSLDFSQRFSVKIAVSISSEDYPENAKKSNLGKVKVSVALYIGSDGKIKDVQIRKIESQSGNIDAFKQDFIQSVRKVFLQKSKVLSEPYKINGEYKDFIWHTTVTFTLEN